MYTVILKKKYFSSVKCTLPIFPKYTIYYYYLFYGYFIETFAKISGSRMPMAGPSANIYSPFSRYELNGWDRGGGEGGEMGQYAH
jgi:hypothetical protein